MRKASRVLYVISIIVLLLNILLYVAASWISFRGLANPQWDFYKAFIDSLQKSNIVINVPGVETALILGIAFGAIAALYFIVFIFALWGSRAAKYSNKKGAHVWNLILGILSLDPLLIVAAGIGIGAAGQKVE